jgi:hypothetical protein
MNVWVFVYFTQDKGQEALWSLATVVAGGVAYYVSRRGRRG